MITDTKGLKRGNLLKHDTKGYGLVSSIFNETDFEVTIGDKPHKPDGFDYIEITNDILDDLGFTYYGNHYWELPLGPGLILLISAFHNLMQIGSVIMTAPKYVHTLQNMVYDLSRGKSLDTFKILQKL